MREQAITSPAGDYVALYHEAFEKYFPLALWNKVRLDHPEPGHALVIATALRYEGNLEARRLAEAIERACRALDLTCL